MKADEINGLQRKQYLFLGIMVIMSLVYQGGSYWDSPKGHLVKTTLVIDGLSNYYRRPTASVLENQKINEGSTNIKSTTESTLGHSMNKKQRCNRPVMVIVRLTGKVTAGVKELVNNAKKKDITILLVYSTKLTANKQEIGDYIELSVEVRDNYRIEYKSNQHRSNVYVLSSQQILHLPVSANYLKHAMTLKNMAYLISLKLGACSIFELDENLRIADINFFSSSYITELNNHEPLTLHSFNKTTMNPYGVFGTTVSWGTKTSCAKPTYFSIHPRGTPHSDMTSAVVPTLYMPTLSTKPPFISKSTRKSGIVQVLISDWPDLNSKKHFSCGHKIYFKSRLKKAQLDDSQFAAINNKATLFFRDIAWTMFTPPSIPDYISDILRGYIAQTMLRCTGHAVVFHQPIVTALSDQHLKTNVSYDTSKFIYFLEQFQCLQSNKKVSSQLPISVCFKQLYQYLHLNNMLSEQDLNHLNVWLNALEMSGYSIEQPSQIHSCNVRDSKNDNGKQPVLHTSLTQPFKKLHEYNLRTISGDKNLSNIILVVSINFKHIDVIPMWMAMYQHFVPPMVVFYSAGAKPCHSILTKHLICNASNDVAGMVQHGSMADAMRRFPGYSMYVFVHDDMVFSPLIFQSLLKSGESTAMMRPLIDFCISKDGKSIKTMGGWWPHNGKSIAQLTRMLKSNDLLPLITKFSKYCPRKNLDYAVLNNTDQAPCLSGGGYLADGFAVTGKDVNTFLQVSPPLSKHNVYTEVAIPWIMKCVLGAGSKPSNTFPISGTRFRGRRLDPQTWNQRASELVKREFCQKMQNTSIAISKMFASKSYKPLESLYLAHPVKLVADDVYLYQALLLHKCFTGALQ